MGGAVNGSWGKPKFKPAWLLAGEPKKRALARASEKKALACASEKKSPGLRQRKKKPWLAPGLGSLVAVITPRHLLREEKQGTTASRLSSKMNFIRVINDSLLPKTMLRYCSGNSGYQPLGDSE
jgi:hypothetical protein